MNILITDSNAQSVAIGVGRKSQKSPIMRAAQITGWKEARLQPTPFGFPRGGDALFDTASLFCFAGAKNAILSNVVMVLWGFLAIPQTGDIGTGVLNAPPATGKAS